MHQRDLERTKIFNRRVAMLAGGKAVLLSALVGRLYYLQVLQADRYATLADDNRINIQLLAPPTCDNDRRTAAGFNVAGRSEGQRH